jgi:hypothetical protein
VLKINKENIFKFVAFLLLVLAIILALRFLTSEDTWLCEKGQWVRHGNPATEAPTEQCK